MAGPVAEMTEEQLVEVPGIGKAIAKKIRDIIETGTCEELEELKAKIPPALIELLKLEGVGPKTVATLWKKMNIQSIEDLEKAAKGRRIRAVKGFGEKKEAAILDAIALYRSAGGRMNRLEAEAVVTRVTGALTPGTWEVAGSATVGEKVPSGISISFHGNPLRQ